MQQYYVFFTQQPSGPYTIQHLRRFAASNQLSPNHKVIGAGMQVVEAKSIVGVFSPSKIATMPPHLSQQAPAATPLAPPIASTTTTPSQSNPQRREVHAKQSDGTLKKTGFIIIGLIFIGFSLVDYGITTTNSEALNQGRDDLNRSLREYRRATGERVTDRFVPSVSRPFYATNPISTLVGITGIALVVIGFALPGKSFYAFMIAGSVIFGVIMAGFCGLTLLYTAVIYR